MEENISYEGVPNEEEIKERLIKGYSFFSNLKEYGLVKALKKTETKHFSGILKI